MSIRAPAGVTATYQSDGRRYNDRDDNCYHAYAHDADSATQVNASTSREEEASNKTTSSQAPSYARRLQSETMTHSLTR